MILGMLLQTIYNFADAVWVSGLGYEALSAIGLFFPVFMLVISVSSGVSIGVSSTISRRIGAGDREAASRAASYGVTLSLILGALITASLLLFLDDFVNFMTLSPHVAKLTLDYSLIVARGTIFIVLSMMLGGILRGEGDARRATYALAAGSILNIILDPVFIYHLNLGISGAAYATVLSTAISTLILLYWLLIKRDAFVSISLRKISLDREMREILRVGIPSSVSQLSMSISMFVLNTLVLIAGGEEGIAVFTSSWRVITFGIVPLFGVASATTAVTAAFYGARNIEKLERAYFYSIKLSLLIELVTSLIIILSAPQISLLFTSSAESVKFCSELILSMRTLSLFLPTTPLGMMTASMFQGIGKGERALAITIFRAIILQLLFAYLLLQFFSRSLISVWLGMVLGNALASIFALFWGIATLRTLRKFFSKNPEIF
ncbi:MAG: hypothetical protein PWR13_922 [Archaeoglobi archaeon]|nr:hypothetical protein [Archaeoglobi archaeon]MDK2781894.1 hypothetical protein [Archaeoglobi archaeon]